MEYWANPLLQYPSTPIFIEEVLMAMLSVGTKAPEFTLPVSREQNVSLKDYHGQKNVVLAFYPLDFTGG
jgi:peroxiredoxin Q/BCP